MRAIGRQLAEMELDLVGLQEMWMEADRGTLQKPDKFHFTSGKIAVVFRRTAVVLLVQSNYYCFEPTELIARVQRVSVC